MSHTVQPFEPIKTVGITGSISCPAFTILQYAKITKMAKSHISFIHGPISKPVL